MLYPQFRRSYPPSLPHLGSVRLHLIEALTHSLRILKIFFSANALAQLLTVPPYVVAAIVMLSLSYASDKLQTRGIFLCVGCTLGGIGYLYVCSLDPDSFFFRLLLLRFQASSYSRKE